MRKLSLCKYSDAHILVKETITVASPATADSKANNTNIKVILKNCTPFEKCITEKYIMPKILML